MPFWQASSHGEQALDHYWRLVTRSKFHAQNLPTAPVPDSVARTHAKLQHPMAFEKTQSQSIRIVTQCFMLTYSVLLR